MKFRMNNPVFQFISATCDFIALNICFLVTCIPVVTIGAALTALYTVTLKEVRGEGGYLVKPYFRAFRVNLKNGMLSWLIQLAVSVVLLFNIVFWYRQGGVSGTVMAVIMGLILACLTLCSMYVYPLHARFSNGIRQTFHNAFGLLLLYKKQTMGLFCILIAAAGLYFVSRPFRILMTVIGFAFTAYCQSLLLNQVFSPYERAEIQK